MRELMGDQALDAVYNSKRTVALLEVCIVFYVGGFFLWLVDRNFCPTVRSMHLHALWHLGAGTSTTTTMVTLLAHDMRCVAYSLSVHDITSARFFSNCVCCYLFFRSPRFGAHSVYILSLAHHGAQGRGRLRQCCCGSGYATSSWARNSGYSAPRPPLNGSRLLRCASTETEISRFTDDSEILLTKALLCHCLYFTSALNTLNTVWCNRRGSCSGEVLDLNKQLMIILEKMNTRALQACSLA